MSGGDVIACNPSSSSRPSIDTVYPIGVVSFLERKSFVDKYEPRIVITYLLRFYIPQHRSPLNSTHCNIITLFAPKPKLLFICSIYIYMCIYIYIVVIFIWWSPFIPTRNLNEVFTYIHTWL